MSIFIKTIYLCSFIYFRQFMLKISGFCHWKEKKKMFQMVMILFEFLCILYDLDMVQVKSCVSIYSFEGDIFNSV